MNKKTLSVTKEDLERFSPRRLSVKWRLTLWFVGSMLVLVGAMLGLISFFFRMETRRHAKDSLIAQVSENANRISFIDDEPVRQPNFIASKDGFTCLIYNRHGSLLFGTAPNDTLLQKPLEEGHLNSIKMEETTYLIYDQKIVDKDKVLYLRGILDQTQELPALTFLLSSFLISIPPFILFAAIGGYLLANHSLRPIRTIQETADEIEGSADLSKRIAIDSKGDELRRLTDSFNRMFDRLEKSFDREKQFTADVSHELRTPITTILAECEYAFEDANGVDELLESIGDIQSQGYRMKRLVETLLSFARLEQQALPDTLPTISLSDLVVTICEDQKKLSQKGITLTYSVTENLSMAAEPVLIRRMLENLIQNAYRYGKPAGTITVTLTTDDSDLLLRVADDGIGIDEDTLPLIWNRFYRADKARTYEEGKGLGLGLSMVKQIVALHHGTIAVNSTPKKGSVFSLRFPGAVSL